MIYTHERSTVYTFAGRRKFLSTLAGVAVVPHACA
jgi:hypothetical protein